MTTPSALALKIGVSNLCEDMQASAAQLCQIMLERQGNSITVIDENEISRDIALVPALSKLMRDILELIEKGNGANFVPYSKLLTSQQAADILDVSRPYFVKLLDAGELSFSKIDRHHRIEACEVFRFKC